MQYLKATSSSYILPLACSVLFIPSIHAKTKLAPIEVLASAKNQQHYLKPSHAGSYRIIHQQAFENTSLSIGELLSQQAGIHLQESGGKGGFQTLNLRGSSGQQIMVYLDGMALNTGDGGSVDLSRISLKQVESIEIYHGNAPVEFASQYQGGVVHIKTRQANENSEISASTGSNAYHQVSLLHAAKKAKINYLVQLNHQQAENNFEFLDDNQTPLNSFDDRLSTRENAQTFSQQALLKVNWQKNKQQTLSFSFNPSKGKQHLPNRQNTSTNQAFLETENYNSQIAWQYQAGVSAKTSLAWLNKHEHYQDLQSQIGLGQQDNHYKSDNWQLQQFFSLPAWQFQSIDTAIKTSVQLLNENYRTQQINPVVSSQIIHQHWQRQGLNANIAFPIYWQTANNASQEAQILPSISWQNLTDRNLTDQTEKQNYTPLDFQLGLVYPFSKNSQFHLAINNKTRIPGFHERYGNKGLSKGNPDLRPEKAQNRELGINLNKGTLQTAINLYWNDIKDLISHTYDARGIGRSENLNQAEVVGLEFKLSYTSPWKQTLSLNSNLQKSKITSNYSAYHNKQVPNFPNKQLQLAIQQPWKNWQFAYQLVFSEEAFYDRANLLPVKAKQLHNLIIKYQYQALLIGLEAINLKDKHFESFNGYPTAGRQFYLNFTYQY